MHFEDLQRVDRRTWRQYLFYVDLVMFAVFAISMTLLIRHTFIAGQFYEEGSFDRSITVFWQVVADVVFLVASLAWIFGRFFRNEYIVMTRKF